MICTVLLFHISCWYIYITVYDTLLETQSMVYATFFDMIWGLRSVFHCYCVAHTQVCMYEVDLSLIICHCVIFSRQHHH